MKQLHSAKVRARRRAAQNGAIMFIVAMTLALLAAIGGFAMMSATTEARTSGYVRRSSQTQYLAEYAVIAGSTWAGDSAAMNLLIDRALASPNPSACPSLANVPAGADKKDRLCIVIPSSGIGAGWTTTLNNASHQILQPVGGPVTPSFGATNTDPSFRARITELSCAMNADGTAQITIEGEGTMDPLGAANDTQLHASRGIATTRAHVIVQGINACKLTTR